MSESDYIVGFFVRSDSDPSLTRSRIFLTKSESDFIYIGFGANIFPRIGADQGRIRIELPSLATQNLRCDWLHRKRADFFSGTIRRSSHRLLKNGVISRGSLHKYLDVQYFLQLEFFSFSRLELKTLVKEFETLILIYDQSYF